MKLNITQKELTEANLDKVGNRIKLRDESLKNFLVGAKSIPYQEVSKPEMQSNVVPEENQAEGYQLLNINKLELANGSGRPISVKEGMFNKLKKNGTTEVVTESEVEVQNTPEIKIEEPVVKSEIEEAKVSKIKETEKKETKNISNSKNVDINKSFEEINSTRQHVLDVKEQADKAQKEAIESDEKLQKLGIEYTETEKMLQEAEIKNKAVKEAIIRAIYEQDKILAEQQKQYEDVIGIANERKEANQKKIDVIQTKIDKTTEKLSTVTNDTARQEEILLALNGYNNVVPFYNESNNYEEENVRRIA